MLKPFSPQVSDIPDQPPEWVSVAAVTRIPEDVPLFSPVGSNLPYNYVRSFHKSLYKSQPILGNRSQSKFSAT